MPDDHSLNWNVCYWWHTLKSCVWVWYFLCIQYITQRD